METMTSIIWLTGALVGITVMFAYVLGVVEYMRLSLTARGTVEQIEARENTLIGTAILVAALVIAVLLHFIGMETIVPMLWQIFELGALFGICAVAIQAIRLAFLVLNASGQSERIAETKSNLFHALIGALSVTLIFIILKYFN
jgi:hypothetical protein